MKPKLRTRFRLSVPVLLVILSLVVAACGGGEPQEHTFELEIQKGSLVQGDSVLRVKQDDIVTIVVTADERIAFHLHGYGIGIGVGPGEPATMEFTADATGNFHFTIHIEVEGQAGGEEIELGRLEVQPR